MKDIEKLKHAIKDIERELSTRGILGINAAATGLYGEDGHVGDDDEHIVGMMWIEEEGTGRCWNIRLQLDD